MEERDPIVDAACEAAARVLDELTVKLVTYYRDDNEWYYAAWTTDHTCASGHDHNGQVEGDDPETWLRGQFPAAEIKHIER